MFIVRKMGLKFIRQKAEKTLTRPTRLVCARVLSFICT